MRKIIVFLSLILISFSFAANHDSPESRIIFNIDLEVVAGKQESLKRLLAELVPAVKASEPNTESYHYFMSADGTKVTLLESYPNSDAAIFHMEAFAKSPFRNAFFAHLAPVSFQVVGNPTPALVETMALYTDDMRAPIGGFTR
jgi:quinol monooxygenase YgiN|tara:strand:- start:293 stop:724 length:432 start_codon:yes stop_codon:yes gene_type:complete